MSEFEPVGQSMPAGNGSTYQAEVQRTPSSNGAWRWRIMRGNPPNTVPMSHPVLTGSARSRQTAENEALAALIRAARA